jgi:peptide/nickel transport system substrate-binding protein
MSVSEDGLTYTIKITDQAYFQDGTQFSAEDIAFSFQLYKTLWNLQNLESIEAIDKTTVKIKLQEPVQDIRYRTSQLYILQKHYWKDLAEDPQKAREFKNEKPIGSGPFILSEFVPGKMLRFEANTKHWAIKPKVNQMIWRVFKQQDEVVEALIKGEIDAIIDLPVPAAQRMRVYPSVRVISGPPSETYPQGYYL